MTIMPDTPSKGNDGDNLMKDESKSFDTRIGDDYSSTVNYNAPANKFHGDNNIGGDDDDETKRIWTDLVRWVRDEYDTGTGGVLDRSRNNGNDNTSNRGGYVHQSLTLQGNGPSRGVVATYSIQKGETLIRIPSQHVLSGEENGIASAVSSSTTSSTTTTIASPWLRCVGAFLRAKQKKKNATTTSFDYEPYLRSLPAFQEYETLQQWSTEDDVKPFLKGTTLGNLLTIDRDTKGIQTRYRQSIEPYLRRIGVISGKQDSGGKEQTNNQSNHETNENLEQESTTKDNDDDDVNYQSFLEASMCISTRGFHLLPTATTPSNDTSRTPVHASNNNNSHAGPFLLPVIDLLNHDPRKACTTLRRYEANESTGSGSFFKMIAERNIAEGEEIFHSYGTDLTSAQLLQTFGFVPRTHSIKSVAGTSTANTTVSGGAAPATVVPTSTSTSTTPVGLRKIDHLIAAARYVKESSFPDSLVLRIKQIQGQTGSVNEGEYDNEDKEDEEDCFWEVHDIPDRPMMDGDTNKPGEDFPPAATVATDDEFLISVCSKNNNNNDTGSTGSNGNERSLLLNEELITLLIAQFLPEDAFLEIFPEGNNNNNDTVRLDRSILIEDYYLGMLVCKSLLVAIKLKTNEYCSDGDDDNDDDNNNDKDTSEESADAIEKAVSGGTATAVGRYLSSTLQQEKSRIDSLLQTKDNDREIYGRTIRIEELKNLGAFCDEIESLVSNLSLGDDEQKDGGQDNAEGGNEKHIYDHSRDPVLPSPPNKKPKVI